MTRLTRSVPSLFVCIALVSCRVPDGPPAPPSPEARAVAEDAQQIHWERNLADALALARAEGRPLLLAVNMDGESASDRIVREEYRDPKFVAATRNYACVVASLFRHNPRDYDDAGRRIPCPRLGCCTCGEHMALEPALFEQLLADGERVAPRHAAILPDGSKAWDLSLSFDLQDIDRAVITTAANFAPASLASRLPTTWDELAARRSHRQRAHLEACVALSHEAADLQAALTAMQKHGDAGSLDALRLIAARLPALSPSLREQFVATVRARGLAGPAATMLREFVQTIERTPGPIAAAIPVWLHSLASIDGDSTSTRSFLLACRAVDYAGSDVALATAFGPDASAIEATLARLGGPLSLPTVLETAAAVRRAAAGAPPTADPFTIELATAEVLTQDLAELDARLQQDRNNTELRARYAKASLDLARRQIESGGKNVAILLADAEQSYARVLAAQPERGDWWIERARTAYFQSRFDDEAEFARTALQATLGRTLVELPLTVPLQDASAVEALRWLGDADIRRFGARLEQEPALAIAAMLEGLRAFAFVATSPFGDDTDWTSFASFHGALGLWREQFAAARVGALRVPDGRAVRQCITQALWSGGRSEFGPVVAEDTARDLGTDHPGSADAHWFLGYAWMLQAENERRTEQPAAAQRSYATARAAFARAATVRAEYTENCNYYQALCWLGSGLAEAHVGHREGAAKALRNAIQLHQNLAGATDGLGYDVLDLVDKIGEWRASGPSEISPFDLLASIEAVAPGEVFYAVAIADSELREALRADGRNPIREERSTVDAAGQPIRMLMGLPNDEGDGYLRNALAILRRVKDRLTTEEDRTSFAQTATTWAERQLERNRTDDVATSLNEAATMLGKTPPAAADDLAALRACATELRTGLGEARPRWRMGR
jgi:hypothetical protein